MNGLDGYVVKSYDLAPTMTEVQLTKFKGLSLATNNSFHIKRVWIEYPNPDYNKPDVPGGEGTYELITEKVVSSDMDLNGTG